MTGGGWRVADSTLFSYLMLAESQLRIIGNLGLTLIRDWSHAFNASVTNG